MYNSYAKIGQVWEWKSSPSYIYLIIGKKKLYDGSSVLPSRPVQYIFQLIELSHTNPYILDELFNEQRKWKLLIDIEPNR